MKLATWNDGTRDGYPLIVSKDLTRAISARYLAPSLLGLIEQWKDVAPTLKREYDLLNEDEERGAPFDPAQAAAPLPRAPQWLDGSAFPTHGERMVKAFNLSDKTLNLSYPLMYQGMSDGFLGARDTMLLPSEEHGIDLEAEVAVITDDVPMSANSRQGGEAIRLVMLVNDVSLRNLLFAEMSLGFGMIQCKPTCVFSPVCVTPDELGGAWDAGRMNFTMTVDLNGKRLGKLNADEMAFSFGELVAHAAKTRSLSAGTIIGSGTFSNADPSRGVACVAERRALEKLNSGAPITEWLRFGDRVRIDVVDDAGGSIFGAIDHTFARYVPTN